MVKSHWHQPFTSLVDVRSCNPLMLTTNPLKFRGGSSYFYIAQTKKHVYIYTYK